MTVQVIINCGKAYHVTLTAKDLRVFEKAKADPSTKNKKGEELVAAIVALGGVVKIARHKNGLRHDGPHGEPALVMFNDNGTPRAIRHFTHGLLNDGKNGEIAVQQFNHVGDKLVYALRYTNGTRGHKLTEGERAEYLAGLSRGKSVGRKSRINLLRAL